MNGFKICGLIVLGYVPEILLSWVITALNDGGIKDFFLGFAIIMGLYLVIWIKTTVWEWALFLLNGKKTISDAIFNFLVENKFPDPSDYMDHEAKGYFTQVADDREISPEIRVQAAVQVGSVNTLAQTGNFHRAIRAEIGWDDGFEKFRRSFRPQSATDSVPSI